jgi:hypothetical protein
MLSSTKFALKMNIMAALKAKGRQMLEKIILEG